jgi:hypothetical protein
MGAISGDVNSLAMHCVNATDLASRPIAGLKSGDQAYLADRVGTVEGPLFFLDKTSVTAVNGVGILATNGSVGRWLSEALYGGNPISAEETFVPLLNQTVFTLAAAPVPSSVQMFVNGIRYDAGVDYLVGVPAATQVTWADIPFTLDPLDQVIFFYTPA